MAGIEPYSISVPDSSIQFLKDKLALNTFPDELSDAAWDLGAPLADIKRLANCWQHSFDWRAAEYKLNTIPQFKTSVPVNGFGDIGLHFVHQKSEVKGAIPLLFVHGWPGSYIEVKRLLPLLRGGNGMPAFEVIAPSLPNFGWSDSVKKRGFGLAQYAEACHKLMLKLGHEQYGGSSQADSILSSGLTYYTVTQGGDWGFYVSSGWDLTDIGRN